MSLFKELTDPAHELAGLKKVSLSELHPLGSLSNRYVEGKIVERSPLIDKGSLPVLRVTMKDSSTSINVYTFGDFAIGIDAYKIGDTIYISNAVIERSHTSQQDGHHKCHLMVHKSRSRALVWVRPQNTTDDVTTTSTSAANTSKTSSDNATCNKGTPVKPSSGKMTAIIAESSPMKTNRSYNYTLLNNIKEAPKVDVYGVVKFFKPPYKTKGPDYCMSVTIVDPSLPQDNHGLKCVIFHQDIKKLPQVHSIGDIIRLHRLRIQKYNSEYQGTKGDGFSSLVFDGKPNAPMEPRASSPNYTLTDEDKKQVKDLRNWATQQTLVPLAGKCWTLSQIVSREYFDLKCQVVAVAIIPAESCVLIKVWDGTKYKWPVRCLDVSKVQVKWDTELACRAEGLMLDVALYDNHMKAGRELKPGDFVRLYNLHAAPFNPNNSVVQSSTSANQDDVTTDMIELVLHRGTSYGRGLTVMREYEEDVRIMKQRMENQSRSQSNSRNQPSSSGQESLSNGIEFDNLDFDLLDPSGDALTRPAEMNASYPTSLSNHQEVQGMQKSISVITKYHCNRSIKQIVNHPPLIFRTKAAVVDYYPRSIQDFVHLFCQKCRMSCQIPNPKNGTTTSRQDDSDLTNTVNDRKRKAEQGTESPRRSRRIRKQVESSSDSSQERSKEREKGIRGRKRQVTTVMNPQTTKDVPSAVAYIKDLTVQESLALTKEGMKLMRVPKVYMRGGQERRNQANKRTQLYVCPTCCPDQHESKDVVLLNYRYWLKLWLQDSSEKIETILQGSEAGLFFGVAPTNLHVNSDSRLSIADKIGRLCPNPGEAVANSQTDSQNNPKLDCCVEVLTAFRQGSRKVMYYIRDTELAFDVK